VTRDRCYDFKNIFAKKFGEKNGVFSLTVCKILIIALACEKNAKYFAENWQKLTKLVIMTNFRLLGDCLLWTVFLD
jgi:hypothetical protein